jgi:tetratricopeptide (TPR) repeat protein
MRTTTVFAILMLAVSVGGFSACATTARSPYKTPSEVSRDTDRAQRLTQQAADLIPIDPARAERLLREALAADLYHGPAHNNLGVIYLERGELYEAANEFEWARKLMPGHPDPRLNLALTLEQGGRIDEAITTYDAALEVYPGHLPTIMALARAQLRHNRTDERTDGFLDEIALRGDEAWRHWATMQRLRRQDKK